MTADFDRLLQKYADLAVQVGLNLMDFSETAERLRRWGIAGCLVTTNCCAWPGAKGRQPIV